MRKYHQTSVLNLHDDQWDDRRQGKVEGDQIIVATRISYTLSPNYRSVCLFMTTEERKQLPVMLAEKKNITVKSPCTPGHPEPKCF
jgi:hypothetical protein